MARILILCSRVPYPLTGGAKLRMFHTAEILAEHHTVDLLIIDETGVNDKHIETLEETFHNVNIFTYPKPRFYLNASKGLFSRKPLQTHYFEFEEVHNWIEQRQTKYDLLYCNHVRTGEYARQANLPYVVDLVDAISRNYASRTGDGVWSVIYPIESRRLLNYERKLVQESEHAFIITQEDKEYILTNEISQDDLTVVPNGVRDDLLKFDTPIDSSGPIVFLGKMDYEPNVDAVRFFSDRIYPSIRQQYPETEFVIVGSSPTEEVQALSDRKGICVTGFVEDPAEYLAAASVIVAPLRLGAGLQNKVLEGMALGKPVVATPLAREGIKATDGKHIRVADSPQKFAEVVGSLLDSPDKRQYIGENARERIRECYQWDQIKQKLLQPIQKVLEDR